MLTKVLMGTVAAAFSAILMAADSNADIAKELIARERQAMDGWLTGNPDPALAISDPEITLFHIMTGKRLDGLAEVRALYEKYRGTPLFDAYEIVDPKVQVSGDTAILTYILVRHNGGAEGRWNATQVYVKKKEGWRVIHSHWSANQT